MKDTSPVEEQQDDSLETQLSDAFDAMDAEETEEVTNEEIETETTDEITDEAEDVTEETTDEITEETVEETTDEVEFNEPAPERWPDDIKEAYNALPPATREVMLEKFFKPMQRAYTEKTQSMAQMRKQLSPMVDILQKHQGSFERAGIDPIQALNRQMEWSAHFARVGNEQGAKDLAAAYGTGQQDESTYLTPVEKRQQAQIDQMQQQLQANVQTEQQRQQQAQQQAIDARTSDVRTSIQTFANETRNGKPVHPHVEQVSTQMAGLIRGGLVNRTDEYGQPVPFNQQLGEAYKIACQMDSTIRTASEAQTNREQVARASAANREVVSKTPGTDVKTDDGPLADSISDLYDRLDRSVA